MIKDNHISRRKRMYIQECNNMIARYETECKDLGSHIETAEEKADRIKRQLARERSKEYWQLTV